jgi:hypothetical protein
MTSEKPNKCIKQNNWIDFDKIRRCADMENRPDGGVKQGARL